MDKLALYWFLLKIFGRRAFWGYGLLSMLSVSILTGLYFSSRYGLQTYVSDQLGRIPWDVSIIQRAETHRFRELQAEYHRFNGVKSVASLGFLRARNMAPFKLEADGRPFPIRWVAFITTSLPDLLPPELRKGENAVHEIRTSLGALPVSGALVGAHAHLVRDQISRIADGTMIRLSVQDSSSSYGGGHHHEASEGPVIPVFEGRLVGSLAQIERQEFNKWMLREVGSLSYLPEEALVFPISPDLFEKMATHFHHLLLTSEGVHGGEAPPTYVPEMTHLIALDRDRLFSSWDLEGSLLRLKPVVQQTYERAQWITPFSYAGSDLYLLTSRMNSIAKLVDLATLLIAVPLLWMGWILARTLSRLLVLNERRLLGLALMRGIPMTQIGHSLLLALALGGLAGGVAGLLAGGSLSISIYAWLGYESPPYDVLLSAVFYFVLFLGVGLMLALLSGRSILGYVRRLTPREAGARSSVEQNLVSARRSFLYAFSAVIGLLLGGYKILSWLWGYSPLLAAVNNSGQPRAALSLLETVLNFVAIPLFLYGLAGLLVWRAGLIQRVLDALSAPLVGRLHWFVSHYMALGRRRIAQLLFVAALAACLSLLPQIAADIFYGRVLSGIRTSLGSNVHLEFDMTDLTQGDITAEPVSRYQERLLPRLNAIRDSLLEMEEVDSVDSIEQFYVPGIYIPGQSGLVLNILDDPKQYLRDVEYEDRLGLTRDFSSIIGSLESGNIFASQGLFRLRAIPLGKRIALGNDQSNLPIVVRLNDMTAFLPGQPSRGIQQREGFVTAEIDYLNYLLGSDARIVTAQKDLAAIPGLSGLKVIPSRTVFLVKTGSGLDGDDFARRVTAMLPVPPEEIRWEAVERKRLSKDMFISLALENMKVYMAGGFILALASVAAIALANFISDRRTFALLRLRGVPLPILLRITLSLFLIPVLGGVLIGIVLGAVSGYGVSQAVWELPRVYGVAGFLSNKFIFSGTAGAIVIGLICVFTAVALGFGLWLFRRTAREAISEA
ncbi:MAG: hypothetical protein HY645_07295 [Acidobacteria bacterium]|nr:hypothetical protein [Acidobacteriota bacterium]